MTHRGDPRAPVKRAVRALGVVALATVVLLAGCVNLSPAPRATSCTGSNGVPELHVVSDWSLALPPGQGMTYQFLGPGRFDVHDGLNVTPTAFDLHGAPMTCAVLIGVGPYIQTHTFAYRLLVSSSPGPFLLLADCTGVVLAPVNGTGPDLSYRVAPLAGTGDVLRSGHGANLAQVPNATIRPNETVVLNVSTERCGNQTLELSITHFGLAKAKWT